MKVAIAHEWIVTLGGSERVTLEFHRLYPQAPIFTTVYDAAARPEFRDADVRPSFLQHIPGAIRRYPQLLPLMPLAFSRFDTRGYDLVLISSHAASKAIRKHPGQLHICYCHTPMRYAWDLYDIYVRQSGLNPAQRLAARAHPLLPEEHGPRGLELDLQRGEGEQRREDDEQHHRER